MSVLVAGLLLAWIAIILLGLAVGGLLSQVRIIEAKLARKSPETSSVVPRFEDESLIPSGAIAVVFVESTCDTCHYAVNELLTTIDDVELLLVADELSTKWMPVPTGVRTVIDPQAARRSGVPAVPWFVAVDAGGRTIESFALGNPKSINRAGQIARELSVTA